MNMTGREVGNCCIHKNLEVVDMDLRTKIKKYSKTKGVPMWKVAKEYGMSDSNFSRMLRYDEKVSEEEVKKIYKIIDELVAGR